MSRSTVLMVLGVLTLLAPFSGIPLSILTWFFVVAGLMVAGVGVSYRAKAQTQTVSHEVSSEPSA